MKADKTRAFMSALPAARRTLLGCQSTESTVDLMGFFKSLETHQSFSGSKEQTAIALYGHKISNNTHSKNDKIRT